MNLDLSDMLNDWPYEPGQINVRLIQGEHGEPILQVRLDLGLLQLRVEGRPDGAMPHGYGSLLEYHEARFDGLEFGDDESEGTFSLDEDACRQLREEAVQYYHRYIALLVLEDYEGVVRDTSRNLRLLDLCSEYAEAEQDQQILEQFRPYITMMRTRALASLAMNENEPKAAAFVLDDGITTIKTHFEETGRPEQISDSSEVQMLEAMREALLPKLPVSQKAELKQRLKEAIQNENYELASILRDELRMLGDA